MSGFPDHPFYHHHQQQQQQQQHSEFYPTPAATATAADLESQTDSSISHDPHTDSLGPSSSSLLDFSQSAGAAGAGVGGPYALGQFQEVFDQSSLQDPDFFRVRADATAGAAATGTLLTTQQQQQQQQQQQRQHQQSGYSIRENTDDLANDVYGAAWPAAAGNVFPYEIPDAYSMSSLASQQLYSVASFPTQAAQGYWDVGFQNTSSHEQHHQQQAVPHEQYSQSYPSLQPRAIQPKPHAQVSAKERLPASESPFENVYSSSGFDIMGALARVISRPDPRINIGAVDLSCAFVLCDITLDDDPIVYMSEAFGRLTGYTDDELIGQNCRFLQSPDGRVQSGAARKFVDSSAAFQLRSTIEDRSEVQVSIINYRKGGQPFMNLVTMVPIRWDSDEYRYYVGFQVDLVEKPDAVTKRNPNGTYMINYQRSQLPSYVPPPNVAQNHPDLASFAPGQVSAVLRSVDVSRPGYKQCLDRVLAENADDVIYVLSFDGAFLYVSPSCRKALEYEPAELLSKPLSFICHPSDIGPVLRDLRASINTAPVSVTYRIRKKNSGYVWFETHGSWHVERGRGRTFLVLVGRERPVYSLSPMASLKNNTTNTLSEYDLWTKLSTSGIILYASTKSRPVLGRLPEEIVGTGFLELLNAEERAEAQQALQTARAGRQAVFRHQIRHKKGHMVDVQTRLLPGDTKEGVRSSFLVAQIRFPALSQPVLDVSDPSSGSGTVPDANTNTNTNTNKPDSLSSPSSPSRSSSSSSPDHHPHHHSTKVLLPELAPTRSSNWQTELRELERRNKALADEVQRLLARKKKRKRKQSAMPFGKSCVLCQTRNTPEWRRGPSGNRDLCNSCGLRWAKQVRSATLSERSSGSAS